MKDLRAKYSPQKFILSAHPLLIDVVGRNHAGDLWDADRAFGWQAHCHVVVVWVRDLSIERIVGTNCAGTRWLSHGRTIGKSEGLSSSVGSGWRSNPPRFGDDG